MTRPIDPARLRELRRRNKLSQQELAKRAKLTKGSLHRLEAGKQPGSRQRTRDGLAKALGVEAGVLTGETPLPPAELAGAAEPEAPESQMNVRLDDAIRNAFWLASKRYRVPMARIVELAPFQFVCAAEASLERRRARLAELQRLVGEQEALADAFPHLPYRISLNFDLGETIAAEQSSIAARNILADDLPDKLRLLYDQADSGLAERNPFLCFLKESGPADKDLASISRFDRSEMEFSVCRDAVLKLCGGDSQLADAVVEGTVPLYQMPSALLKSDAVAERVAWLRERRDACLARRQKQFDAVMALL